MITKDILKNVRSEMLSIAGNDRVDYKKAYEFSMCVCRHLDIWHIDEICIACVSQFLFLCEEFRPIKFELEINFQKEAEK